jgi:hypothetical protein
MKTRLTALAVLLAILAPAAAEEKKPDTSIRLEIKGTVATGIVAIGGETTGSVITTKQGFGCELAGLKDEKLNKKTAIVEGTFQIKEGVEIRQRSILTVTSAKEATEKPDESYVKVTHMIGTLRTGLVAPGGATTGTTITNGNVTWELDFKDNKDFRALAEKLNGKDVRIAGTLEVKASTVPQRKARTIVTVTQFAEAAEK